MEHRRHIKIHAVQTVLDAQRLQFRVCRSSASSEMLLEEHFCQRHRNHMGFHRIQRRLTGNGHKAAHIQQRVIRHLFKCILHGLDAVHDIGAGGVHICDCRFHCGHVQIARGRCIVQVRSLLDTGLAGAAHSAVQMVHRANDGIDILFANIRIFGQISAELLQAAHLIKIGVLRHLTRCSIHSIGNQHLRPAEIHRTKNGEDHEQKARERDAGLNGCRTPLLI